ncbi:hypothetical protein ACHAW6_002716, partial [Cyclotella cf. meneghiniana]
NPFKYELTPVHAPGADTDIDHASNLNNNNTISTLNHAATADNIAELYAQGIEVENKDLAPKNTVAGTTAPTGTWEELRTCPCRGDQNVTNTKGRFVAKPWTTFGEMDELALLCMCFPESFLRKTIVPAMNDHIQGASMMLSKFYFMSQNRFMTIDSALQNTQNPTSTEFVDKFHDVQELIDAFNDHYSDEYLASWINCLDESMNTCDGSMNTLLNTYAQGFISVPCKPHRFGNEYHYIADGDDRMPIMQHTWIQEGKD